MHRSLAMLLKDVRLSVYLSVTLTVTLQYYVKIA